MEPAVTEKPTATKEPAATEKPTATEKPEPEKTPRPTPSPQDGDGEKSGDGVQLCLDFQLSGSWGGEGGYYYQYVASIENLSDRKITDWEIKVPGFEDCKVDSYWCCEVDVEDDCLTGTPADFNEEIWEDGKAEGIGITVLAEDEWELAAVR